MKSLCTPQFAKPSFGSLALVVLLICVATPATHGQRNVIQEARPMVILNRAVPAAVAPVQRIQNSNEDRYLGGAPLKTDPELMEVLENAEKFRVDGNLMVATRLWQSVLQASGDTLYTEDGETYFPLTGQVESILASLPEQGLRTYRISADANAKELMAQAQGPNDLDILSRVVKGYFLSSLGDEAAFRLACIYLDRYDFVGAVRLLNKIVDLYPDPSVPLDEVWLRIAIAYAYVGDLESAADALNKSRDYESDATRQLSKAVQQLIEQSPELKDSSSASGQWTTRLGNARRTGVMPSLPAGWMSQDLEPHWQFFFNPNEMYSRDDYTGRALSEQECRDPAVEATVGKLEKPMIRNWRMGKWRPAGQLLFDQGSVFFKTGADLTAWQNQGATLSVEPKWRPLWLNRFALDDSTILMQQMRETYGQYDKSRQGEPAVAPKRNHEFQLFFDQIAQSMSIYRGVVYNVEGEEYNLESRVSISSVQPPRFSWGALPRRTRTNYLTAYDAESGMLRWRVPKPREAPDSPEPGSDFDGVGFMAAPIGFGDFIIVPVNIGGSIWLYALDSQSEGALVWKSYLCDEPSGGSQAWAPIHVAIEGSSAYVCCGTGVVFAVDPMTGGIRYARRYERTGEINELFRRFGNQSEQLDLDGWREDFVIPIGNVLLVIASDFNTVWAIDRETAEFVWKTENRPFGKKFDYLIGVYDDYVFLGGTESIAAISVTAQGRWEWVQSFEDEHSMGQAMVTPDGVYVPVGDAIVQYAHKGEGGFGKELARANVRLGTGAPVGNLFSDGKRIWAVGANRLYALGPAAPPADGEGDSAIEVDGQLDDQATSGSKTTGKQ